MFSNGSVQLNSDNKPKPDLSEILKNFDKEPSKKEFDKGFSVSYEINYQNLNLGKKLGQGSFGIVYKGSFKTGGEVAVKQLQAENLTPASEEEFSREAATMAQLHHPNVVHFYGYCSIPKCLVMEYMPKGSLFNVLHDKQQMLDWDVRIRIAVDMVSGLAFLHSKNILHRDIKSLNVLLDEQGKAKLTDFGLSRIKEETKSKEMTQKTRQDVGTIQWMAPELFRRKAVYTQKSDIYSLGMTLWELSSRKIPYAEDTQAAIPAFVERGDREDIPQDCPPKLAYLIQQCWAGSPETRPTASDVVKFMTTDAKTLEEASSHSVAPVPTFNPSVAFNLSASATSPNNVLTRASKLEVLAAQSGSGSKLNVSGFPTSPAHVDIKVKEEGNTQNLTTVSAELSQRMHQAAENFVAGRDIVKIIGGVRGAQIAIGGGNSSSTEPSSESSSKTVVAVDNMTVLKQLKSFFMSNKYKGSESPDCELYNKALEAHQAALVYLEDEHVHKLFVNDEPLEQLASIKIISKMIASLQSLNSQNLNASLNAANSTTHLGNTRVQACAGRDVVTITDGVRSEGTLRIGGGDTHHNFTAYNQFKSQAASQYNVSGLINNSGNVQLGDGNTQHNKTNTWR